MPQDVQYQPLTERRGEAAERLRQIQQRLDKLRSGRAVEADDVDMARRSAINAAVMSAAAHDRLSERYEAASIIDPQNVDAYRSAADAQRSASDVALGRAFGKPAL